MGTVKAWATRRTDVPLTGRGSGQVSRPVTSLLISDRSLRGAKRPQSQEAGARRACGSCGS
eukprot:6415345-Pyramimonas_sp.AAC.1